MGIELKPCSKCGGKGRLYDFDHMYNPKNKPMKFLNNGNGLTTAAECLNCKRFTEHFNTPIESINETDINPPAELGRLADASSDKQSTRIKTPVV